MKPSDKIQEYKRLPYDKLRSMMLDEEHQESFIFENSDGQRYQAEVLLSLEDATSGQMRVEIASYPVKPKHWWQKFSASRKESLGFFILPNGKIDGYGSN